MDFLSHALWGGIAFGRTNTRAFILAALFGVLPDLLSEGIMFTLAFLGLPGMPEVMGTHPNITDFPAYAQMFYNMTHSLIFAGLVIVLICLLFRRVVWPVFAWPLHILIDIPTHSKELFPTPFLFPISTYTFDGIPWDHPYILIPNFLFLAFLYGIWIYITIRNRRERRARSN